MDYDSKRREMVETQLKSRDIVDARVIKAMLEVPRHEFVPPELKDVAYGDFPLPIGEEQTISQPYIVALMTQELCLRGDEKVLEVGAGSGYQAAILSRIAKKVFTVERNAKLAEHCEKTLGKLSYLNATVVVGDGSTGLAKQAPFDAIIVTAGCPNVPKQLKEQLKVGGRMVIPVGDRLTQVLISMRKTKDGFDERKICDCAFVPLIGEEGWK
jgi:protein-L-isoaspartate(D-aspartate) O-methyltransferase